MHIYTHTPSGPVRSEILEREIAVDVRTCGQRSDMGLTRQQANSTSNLGRAGDQAQQRSSSSDPSSELAPFYLRPPLLSCTYNAAARSRHYPHGPPRAASQRADN